MATFLPLNTVFKTMQIVHHIGEMREQLKRFRSKGERIGLVPTMGNLHAGHLQLVDTARQQADRCVVSLFVNPTQFGANEDLDNYPRTFEDDVTKLIDHHTDVLFAPTTDEIYPLGGDRMTQVHVPELTHTLCGASRPGHFDGVTTVVSKLFNMVQPDVAVFGEKDFQQLAVIRRMTEDLNFSIKIIGEPIVREADGLAMSSRNGYLNPEERKTAPLIYNVLQQMSTRLIEGESMVAACNYANQQLCRQGFKPDYIEIRRPHDLQVANDSDSKLVILIAAFLGRTRLIDNLVVNRPSS